MSGMNTHSGGELDGIEHLKQSIRDILTTPIGTRVMRRAYGSRLFELVDAPINRRTIASIYAATAEALRKWEPRFVLKRVSLEKATPGTVSLTLFGEYVANGNTGNTTLTVEVAR